MLKDHQVNNTYPILGFIPCKSCNRYSGKSAVKSWLDSANVTDCRSAIGPTLRNRKPETFRSQSPVYLHSVRRVMPYINILRDNNITQAKVLRSSVRVVSRNCCSIDMVSDESEIIRMTNIIWELSEISIVSSSVVLLVFSTITQSDVSLLFGLAASLRICGLNHSPE